MTKNCKALLLAGGLGTRLRPLTNTMPKCLVPIANRPLLDYWLDALEHAGITDVLINTHHLRAVVLAYIEETIASRDLTVTETYEPELLGSAGTVSANRGWADDADVILVIYADNLSNIDLAAFLAAHRAQSEPCSMALFHTAHPKACGIATLDENNRVVDFIEKPEMPVSDLANAGLYAIDKDAWREIADLNAFDFGFDVLPTFIGRMHGYVHDGYHLDIGTPEALAKAEADVSTVFGQA